MASIFEKEPIFSHKRLWDDTTKLPEKYKFSGRAGKAEVHMDSGSLGMEFFYEKTFPDFVQAATKLDWDWYETFSQFENVLEGSYKTAWREVVRDHFSDESAIVETQNNEAGFHRAVWLFVCTILESETPRDVQYIYLAPGGDHQIRKDLLTAPRDHARRFKEMLRITELLPPGETPPPTEKLAVQWYYMTYHRADRSEYVKSGKKLADETIKALSAYFQLLFAQRKIDGTLERHKVERLRNRAKRTLANDIREKREARRSNHTTLVARRASASKGDTTEVDRTAEAGTINATTIDAAPPTADRDATDAADPTTNQNAETATVEAIARGNATTTTMEQRRRKSREKKTATTKKIDAMTAIDAATAIVIKKSRCITPITATRVATTSQKTTTKIRTSTTTTYRGRRQAATPMTTILSWRSKCGKKRDQNEVRQRRLRKGGDCGAQKQTQYGKSAAQGKKDQVQQKDRRV
jgi:hypothetical protein